jgi:tetratricopeptide (TPR) repeat protein
LPADTPGFVGRLEQLARLDALLAVSAANPAGRPAPVVISAVSGTAGIGKTALAVHWAHRAAAAFPAGQLYANLRGFDRTGRVMQPSTAVRGFLDALGVRAERIPADFDAQTALYRSVLAGKRILIVLDNARDAEQVRALLPGTPTAFVVVTSRSGLTGLIATEGAYPLVLDVLSPVEAGDLLRRRLPAAVSAMPAAAEQIATACARLPLALSIAAARAAQTGFPLTVLAAELADRGRRLAALDADDPAAQVRTVFSWSYQALTAPAARMFRLLGLVPGPTISAAAAASLAALSRPQTRRLLADLCQAGLLTEPAPDRYGFHDLLAAYAADLTCAVDPDGDRQAATIRLVDHYVHTAHAAERILNSYREPMCLPLAPPSPGTAPERPATTEAATAWLVTERPVLLATLRQAADTGPDTHVWQLAWTLHIFLRRRAHWREMIDAWEAAAAAADRLGAPVAGAQAHTNIAHAAIRLGRLDDAYPHLLRALWLSVQSADRVIQSVVQLGFVLLRERQGRYRHALGHAQRALALCEAAGNSPSLGHALNNVGWCQILTGNTDAGLTYCQRALAVYRKRDDISGQADAWDSLGYAHRNLGQYRAAIQCYQHGLDLFRRVGDGYEQAATLNHLGDAQHAAGHLDAAISWTEAADILTAIGHPLASTVRAKYARRQFNEPAPTGRRPANPAP